MINEKYSYLFIARFFNCDHTSIIYHARKIGVISGDRPLYRFPVVKERERKVFVDPRHPTLQTEKLNKGKTSYADYIKETQDRNTRKIYLGEFVF